MQDGAAPQARASFVHPRELIYAQCGWQSQQTGSWGVDEPRNLRVTFRAPLALGDAPRMPEG